MVVLIVLEMVLSLVAITIGLSYWADYERTTAEQLRKKPARYSASARWFHGLLPGLGAVTFMAAYVAWVFTL